MHKIAICKYTDNCTFLTVGKVYPVLKENVRALSNSNILVIADDGEGRIYDPNRFKIIEQEKPFRTAIYKNSLDFDNTYVGGQEYTVINDDAIENQGYLVIINSAGIQSIIKKSCFTIKEEPSSELPVVESPQVYKIGICTKANNYWGITINRPYLFLEEDSDRCKINSNDGSELWYSKDCFKIIEQKTSFRTATYKDKSTEPYFTNGKKYFIIENVEPCNDMLNFICDNGTIIWHYPSSFIIEKSELTVDPVPEKIEKPIKKFMVCVNTINENRLTVGKEYEVLDDDVYVTCNPEGIKYISVIDNRDAPNTYFKSRFKDKEPVPSEPITSADACAVVESQSIEEEKPPQKFVICKKNKSAVAGYSFALTIGKKYLVLEETKVSFLVNNDADFKSSYGRELFFKEQYKPKILPCPCCGSPAKLISNTVVVKVRCTICEIATKAFDTPAAATECWNKRPTSV